jgi:hypothetical protein
VTAKKAADHRADLTVDAPLSVPPIIVAVIPYDGISPRGDPVTGDDAIWWRVNASHVDPGCVGRSGRVPVSYRIVVRGEVSERFVEPLEGVVVETDGGRSILRVEIVDQAKLHAVLGWLFDHGVDLVSLSPAAEANPDGVAPVD